MTIGPLSSVPHSNLQENEVLPVAKPPPMTVTVVPPSALAPAGSNESQETTKLKKKGPAPFVSTC